MREADRGLHASKYDEEHAARYFAHHDKNLRTRITTWRERKQLRRALADLGALDSILDVPCGAGRFFSTLLEATAAMAKPTIIGADNSAAMLAIAARSSCVADGRVRLLETSVFALDLPDRSVDCVVCERFFHHLARAEDRRRVLAEIARVARRGAVVSLWVDGNWQARRRAVRRRPADRDSSTDHREPTVGFGARCVVARAAIERELASAGFEIVGRYDLWPGLSMWRRYALRKRS